MTEPSADALALIEGMEQALAELLVAPDTLLVRTDASEDAAEASRRAGDVWFIQGRGDRLHAILACGDAELSDPELIDAFAEAGANWVWLAVAPSDAADAVVRARGRKLGVLSVGDGRVEKTLQAPPRPGIFIKAYPTLRKRWRQIASW